MKLIPIKPKATLFNLAAVERTVKQVMQQVAEDAKVDLEKTTATWQHGVAFTITFERDGVRVDTNDPIWHMVDEGTPPHIITPKRGKVLVFGPGSKPKTRVRVIGSGAGGKGGAPVVAHIVHHPGTEAREFSQVVQETYAAELPMRMNEALGDVLGGARD